MWELQTVHNKCILFRARKVQCTYVSPFLEGENYFGGDKHW